VVYANEPRINNPRGIFKLSRREGVKTRNFSHLTRMAYLPFLFIPIARAMDEPSGSIMMTSPLKSSLEFVDLQFGQDEPSDIK